jgi:Xaa-Pro aminopeptidase
LVHKVGCENIDALLVTNPTNVSYLSGFSGEDSYLLVGGSTTVLISDRRFTTQIQEECPTLDVHIRTTGQPMIEAVSKVLKRTKSHRVGFESHSTTFDEWRALEKNAPNAEFKPVSAAVEQLRLVKDAAEVDEIREAIRQAERGFALLRAMLTDSITELQAAADLEHAMRRFGARGCSFPPIVAAGDRSALPHARPTSEKIGRSHFVLVDWGATTASGYKSDLTRILVTGKISPKLSKVYRVVLTAQRRGIEAIRPGARCGDVDQAARSVIAKSAYARHFGHGLGHGIGL